MKSIKDFIQDNFPELLLALIGVCLVIVLLLSIRWHDDTTAGWARSSITAVIVGITTLINAIKQPKPNGTATITTTTTADKPTEEKK